MNFVTAALELENCVVGVVQKFHRDNDQIPTFLGTGFFVSTHGVVATCRHVVEHCLSLPVPSDYDSSREGPAIAVVCWRECERGNEKVWGWFQLDVIEIGQATFEGSRPHYVDDMQPDLVFLTVNVRGTPSVSFAEERPEIGEPVGFLGYPMGLRVLAGTAGFRQESATFHAGFVAAINPNRVARSPYYFMVHADTQAGASGSPVFRPDGSVLGMVYMGVPEYYFADPDRAQETAYRVPTALSGCIYGPLMAQSVRRADAHASRLTDRPLYDDRLHNAKIISTAPSEFVMAPYVPPESRPS